MQKVNEGKGGVGYEAMIVTGEMIKDLGNNKFIPIIKQDSTNPLLPKLLSTKYYLDFSTPKLCDDNLISLLKELHNVRAKEKPQLGKNPFICANSDSVQKHSSTMDSSSKNIPVQEKTKDYLEEAQAINALPRINIEIISGKLNDSAKIENVVDITNVGSGTAIDVAVLLYLGEIKLNEYKISKILSAEKIKTKFIYLYPGEKNVRVMMGYKNIMGKPFQSEYIFNFIDNNYSSIPVVEDKYYGPPQ